jgi:aminoglycoside 2'-N-acetyltransferase I
VKICFVESAALDAAEHAELLAVCNAAYGEPMVGYLADIGPGLHALGRVAGRLVTHAMIVSRTLATPSHPVLHTAYVELVAPLPSAQGRGYASALLQALEASMARWTIGALSPSDAIFYARLGWEMWRGPLAVRAPGGLEPSAPDEEVMIRRLPLTPADLDLDEPLTVEWRKGEVW